MGPLMVVALRLDSLATKIYILRLRMQKKRKNANTKMGNGATFLDFRNGFSVPTLWMLLLPETFSVPGYTYDVIMVKL